MLPMLENKWLIERRGHPQQVHVPIEGSVFLLSTGKAAIAHRNPFVWRLKKWRRLLRRFTHQAPHSVGDLKQGRQYHGCAHCRIRKNSTEYGQRLAIFLNDVRVIDSEQQPIGCPHP
jgi:hypothetical protein